MRNILILGHLDLFWIDDDELHVGRAVAVEERGDEGVGHDGLTRTSGTGDEKMRHFGEISNDCAAGDVFADGKSERIVGFFPIGGLKDAPQANVGASGVWNLDTDRASAWDWSLNTDFVDGEVESEFFVAGENLAEVNTGRRLHGVLSDARADIGAFHLDINAELGKRGFDDIGVLLNVAGIGWGLLLF